MSEALDDGRAVRETASMIQKRKNKHRSTRTILRLPDLDHSKTSVLQSLGSAASKRTYGAAIEDFITWYCSEPRLAFGRTVVLRYRYELEARRLAPATINLRLAAVRRLAYEASDNGLLNPDLAAGIRRVKGAKRLPTLELLRGTFVIRCCVGFFTSNSLSDSVDLLIPFIGKFKVSANPVYRQRVCGHSCKTWRSTITTACGISQDAAGLHCHRGS
jgi:hypothetical protein